MAAACPQDIVTEKTILLPPAPSGNGHDAAYRLTVMVPKRRYLSYLRERWWVVLAFLALSVTVTVVYETVRNGTYSSYAQLYVTPGISLFSETKDDFPTQIELLKGSRLQRAALEQLGPAVAQLKTP